MSVQRVHVPDTGAHAPDRPAQWTGQFGVPGSHIGLKNVGRLDNRSEVAPVKSVSSPGLLYFRANASACSWYVEGMQNRVFRFQSTLQLYPYFGPYSEYGSTVGAEACPCLDSTFGQEYTLSTHLPPHTRPRPGCLGVAV